MDDPSFRAFWVDAYHPGIKSPAEVDRLIADVHAANANTILAQVRRRGDAYYNRSSEPRAAELRKQPGYDPLAYLVQAAHAARPRIEVHAWLAMLPVATASAPPTAPEHLYFRHGPDAVGDAMWLSMAEDGALVVEDTFSLDPGHPDAAQYLVNVALNLVRRYGVDGLHFDRIRYAGAQFGYNPVSVRRFCAQTAAPNRPAPADPAWQQWRRDQVTHLMRQLYLEAVALRPRIKISAAVIPWGAGPTNEAAWQHSSAMTAVFQDWLGWLREGIIDMVIPMNYDREADARQRQWFDAWIEWEKNLGTDRHLAVGIGAFLNDIEGTVDQARRALAPSASGGAVQGVAFYSYAGVSKANQPPDALFSALAQPDAAGASPLFTSAVKPPAMPWKTRPATGHLGGTVRYADGRPGDGLTVRLGGPAERTLTVSGASFYGAAGLPPGIYDVSVQRGAEVLTVELADVEAGRVTTLDITL